MNRVIHFEIQADQIQRAKGFYEKAFGWKFNQMMTAEEGGMNYWGIETGDGGPGINGGLYDRPQPKGDQYSLFDCTIQVADIDAAIAAVTAAGGTITRPKGEIPGVGFFARAKDTEGNLFGLMQATEWQPK